MRVRLPEAVEVGEYSRISLFSTLISEEREEVIETNGITLQVDVVEDWQAQPNYVIYVGPDFEEPREVYESGELTIDLRNVEPITGLEFTFEDQPHVVEIEGVEVTDRTAQFEIQLSEREDGMINIAFLQQDLEAIIRPGEGPIARVKYRLSEQSELEQQGLFLFDDIAAYGVERQQVSLYGR